MIQYIIEIKKTPSIVVVVYYYDTWASTIVQVNASIKEKQQVSKHERITLAYRACISGSSFHIVDTSTALIDICEASNALFFSLYICINQYNCMFFYIRIPKSLSFLARGEVH